MTFVARAIGLFSNNIPFVMHNSLWNKRELLSLIFRCEIMYFNKTWHVRSTFFSLERAALIQLWTRQKHMLRITLRIVLIIALLLETHVIFNIYLINICLKLENYNCSFILLLRIIFCFRRYGNVNVINLAIYFATSKYSLCYNSREPARAL